MHRTQQGASAKDGGDYDGLAVLSMVATVVDDDAASVQILSYDNTPGQAVFQPITAEGNVALPAPAGLERDGYWVVLSKAPTGPVSVDFTLDAQLVLETIKGTIEMEVSKKELAARRKKWKPRETMYSSGALWRYAQTVGAAVDGATTHPGAKSEKHVYGEI